MVQSLRRVVRQVFTPALDTGSSDMKRATGICQIAESDTIACCQCMPTTLQMPMRMMRMLGMVKRRLGRRMETRAADIARRKDHVFTDFFKRQQNSRTEEQLFTL